MGYSMKVMWAFIFFRGIKQQAGLGTAKDAPLFDYFFRKRFAPGRRRGGAGLPPRLVQRARAPWNPFSASRRLSG